MARLQTTKQVKFYLRVYMLFDLLRPSKIKGVPISTTNLHSDYI